MCVSLPVTCIGHGSAGLCVFKQLGTQYCPEKWQLGFLKAVFVL